MKQVYHPITGNAIFRASNNPLPLEQLKKPFRKIGNTIGLIPIAFLKNSTL